MPEKLYCYVDESGQDTQGSFFIVAIVLASSTETRDRLEHELSDLEHQLGKKTDWRHTKVSIRQAYLKHIALMKPLQGNILYGLYHGRQDYDQLMGQALIRAILNKRKDPATKVFVEVEGKLGDARKRRLVAALKQEGIRYERVRGKRFQSTPLIRLADAVAGFLSDWERGKPYIPHLLKELGQKDPFERL